MCLPRLPRASRWHPETYPQSMTWDWAAWCFVDEALHYLPLAGKPNVAGINSFASQAGFCLRKWNPGAAMGKQGGGEFSVGGWGLGEQRYGTPLPPAPKKSGNAKFSRTRICLGLQAPGAKANLPWAVCCYGQAPHSTRHSPGVGKKQPGCKAAGSFCSFNLINHSLFENPPATAYGWSHCRSTAKSKKAPVFSPSALQDWNLTQNFPTPSYRSSL